MIALNENELGERAVTASPVSFPLIDDSLWI